MNEERKNTFSEYLGHDFQEKLMWQLLVEPEFAEKVLANLSVEYFDNPNLRRLFIIYNEYYDEFEKVPNIQNKSIGHAIAKYKSYTSTVEEEILTSLVKRFILWNEHVLNKNQMYDGDIIRKDTNNFIKQQEYRKLGELIIAKTKNGEIKKPDFLMEVDERVSKINEIGNDEDFGTEVDENIGYALRKEFRKTIPTSIVALDAVTGGGLGRGEIGIVLAPPGTGKTTLLTKIANSGYNDGKNVLQIIFEDTEDQIKRKHYTIWTGVKLSELNEKTDFVTESVGAYIKNHKKNNSNKLVIKRFSQENTTLPIIKQWMLNYEKKFGIKFDLLVLDYIDCLESHKRSKDLHEGELVIIKSFEALASDLDIPAWSAIQSNRTGIGSEFVEAYQAGGNIKRLHKAHLFMSVGKTPEQVDSQLANIKIIKARFAKDGQMWKDCIFNNDSLEIRVTDNYNVKTIINNNGDVDLKKLEEKTSTINHSIINSVIPDDGPTIGESKKECNIINTETKRAVEITEIKPTNDLLDESSEISKNDKNMIHDMMLKMRSNQGDVRKE